MGSPQGVHKRVVEAMETVAVRSRFTNLYTELVGDEQQAKKADIGWISRIRVVSTADERGATREHGPPRTPTPTTTGKSVRFRRTFLLDEVGVFTQWLSCL